MNTSAASASAATLTQTEDLRSFAVLVHGAPVDQGHPAIGSTLDGVGAVAVDGEHVWVAVDAVLRLAGARADDPEWRQGFENMLTYARSRGWLSEAGNAIRVHIERKPAIVHETGADERGGAATRR